jgi:hypothetical protein
MILQRITTNRTAATRQEFLNGREHIVVPCVIITNGVHEGSNGPLYYPEEELEKTPAVWNAKPVVVYHPTKNGQGVSACDPEIINTRGVGVMMNTRYEKAKGNEPGKLHSEAWCDVTKLSSVDERVEFAIQLNQMMELSTGLFTDNEQTPGEFNGKRYDAIARNYRPDHLALLPDVKGACSIDDGAGFLRLNSANAPIPRHLCSTIADDVIARLATNAKELNLSFDQMHRMVGNAVRQAYPPVKEKDDYGPWVEDLFSSYVVFNRNGKLLRQNYLISNGVATLSGPADEVIRVVDYQKTGAPVGNAQPPERSAMKKEDIVSGLIKNDKSGWKEADREFLLGLTDERLGVIANAIKEEPAPKPTDNANPPANPPTPPRPVSDADYVANAPPGIRDMLQDGLAMAAAERGRLIGLITANKANTLTPEYLGGRTTPELRGIAALAAPPAPPAAVYPNWGGAAPAVNAATPAPVTEEAYVMPTINWETK